jgi:hypothetical protein
MFLAFSNKLVMRAQRRVRKLGNPRVKKSCKRKSHKQKMRAVISRAQEPLPFDLGSQAFLIF